MASSHGPKPARKRGKQENRSAGPADDIGVPVKNADSTSGPRAGGDSRSDRLARTAACPEHSVTDNDARPARTSQAKKKAPQRLSRPARAGPGGGGAVCFKLSADMPSSPARVMNPRLPRFGAPCKICLPGNPCTRFGADTGRPPRIRPTPPPKVASFRPEMLESVSGVASHPKPSRQCVHCPANPGEYGRGSHLIHTIQSANDGVKRHVEEQTQPRHRKNGPDPRGTSPRNALRETQANADGHDSPLFMERWHRSREAGRA